MYQDENEWGAWYDGYVEGYNEAMRWRDPEVELPEFNKKIIPTGIIKNISLWLLKAAFPNRDM